MASKVGGALFNNPEICHTNTTAPLDHGGFLLSAQLIEIGTNVTSSVLEQFGLSLEDVGLQQHPQPDVMISFVELVVMIGILLKMLYRWIQMCCPCFFDPPTRWLACASLYWDLVPEVTVFSAMRMLYFITPQILAIQFYDVVIVTFASAGMS